MRRPPGRRGPLKIVILGAGGNSLAIVDAIIASNTAALGARPVYELVGFLDDLPQNRGKTVMGFPVLGTIGEARELRECRFVNGIASVESFRKKPEVIMRCGVPIERFETIVHPSAVIATGATIGRGCAIMANSVICPCAMVGNHVIILQDSTVNHHSSVADYATISAGVTILGCVKVGPGAFVGGGVSVAPYVTVGENALVGMGSVVIRDVAPGTVVAGNPARELPLSRLTARSH